MVSPYGAGIIRRILLSTMCINLATNGLAFTIMSSSWFVGELSTNHKVWLTYQSE